MLKWQGWVVTTEIVWPSNPKIFTRLSFVAEISCSRIGRYVPWLAVVDITKWPLNSFCVLGPRNASLVNRENGIPRVVRIFHMADSRSGRVNVFTKVEKEHEISTPGFVFQPLDHSAFFWTAYPKKEVILKHCIILLGVVKYLLFSCSVWLVTVCSCVMGLFRMKGAISWGLFYDLLLQVEICKCGNSLMLY